MRIAKRTAWVCFVLVALILCAIQIPQWEISHGISQCSRQSDIAAEACYSALLSKVFARYGLPMALDTVREINQSDKRFSLYCHNTMHDLGHAAYAAYQKSEKISSAPGFAYCGYGFYHGFIEEMFAQTGSVQGALAFCTSLGNEVDVSNCFHGIGHGVADGLDPRAWGDPIAMAAPGLALCRRVAPAAGGLERSCAMGVFNSIELMVPDPKYKLNLARDPFGWCDTGPFTTDEKKACYTEMSVLTMDITHQDYKRAFEYVAAIDPAYQAWAVRYLALYSFSGPQAPKADEVLSACKHVVGKYLDECIEGFTQGLLAYGGADKKYDAAIQFCESPLLSTAQAKLCAHTVVTSDAPTEASLKIICSGFPKNLIPQECIPSATSALGNSSR